MGVWRASGLTKHGISLQNVNNCCGIVKKERIKEKKKRNKTINQIYKTLPVWAGNKVQG